MLGDAFVQLIITAVYQQCDDAWPWSETFLCGLQVNQIGSVTESIQAALDSKAAGWGVMVSHRSGETEDTFIADLSVGLASGQV